MTPKDELAGAWLQLWLALAILLGGLAAGAWAVTGGGPGWLASGVVAVLVGLRGIKGAVRHHDHAMAEIEQAAQRAER